MPDHSEIQLFQLRRGWDKDSFAFSELVFDWNGETIRTICLEIDEIRIGNTDNHNRQLQSVLFYMRALLRKNLWKLALRTFVNIIKKF